MSKLQDALEIRQQIINKLSTEGQFARTNIGAVMGWSNDKLQVIYRTPFTPVPKEKEQVSYFKALIKQQGGHVDETLEYGLDVWVRVRAKCLTWNGAN